MKSTPAIDLVSLVIRHLEDIPNNARRASVLNIAAGICRRSNRADLAESIDVAATNLRQAEDAQLTLSELFAE